MDLIICSQSLHWLDIPKFYLEANRVLCSESGVLAVFGYHPMGLSPECNNNLTPNQISLVEFQRDKIYNMVYWAPEIRLSYEEAYKTIQPIPYPNVERCDEYFVEQKGTLDDFAGYIRTWSGFQTFQEVEGDAKANEVIEDFVKQSKIICGFKSDSEILILRTSFFMLLGIKPA